MASNFKKIPTTIPSPRSAPSAMGRFQKVQQPKLKPLKTRIYTKAVAQQDPSDFTNSGFGDTGMTGES